MVKKIIYSLIFVCLCIAIPLALMGYKQVELGTPFLALMHSVNADLANFKIEIPNIPNIPVVADVTEGTEGADVIQVLINILNALITFVNTVINIINILVQVLNVAIQLLQVIFLILKNLITFKDSIADYNTLPIL